MPKTDLDFSKSVQHAKAGSDRELEAHGWRYHIAFRPIEDDLTDNLFVGQLLEQPVLDYVYDPTEIEFELLESIEVHRGVTQVVVAVIGQLFEVVVKR